MLHVTISKDCGHVATGGPDTPGREQSSEVMCHRQLRGAEVKNEIPSFKTCSL
jgi:hypothetical protein